MVFGWGKKKEKEVTSDSSIQNDLQLSEVTNVIQESLDLQKTETITEVKSLHQKILPLFKELSSIIKSLEKDNLKVDDIDKHIRIIVARGKKQVIDVIKKEVSDLPKISSLDDVDELGSTLNQKLKKMGDVLGRQTRVIHIFAKKYAGQLKEILAELNSYNDQIQSLIRNYRDSQSISDEINLFLDEISNLKSEIDVKKQRIEECNKTINSLEGNANEIENSIKKIKSDSKYKEFLKINQDLLSLKEVKNQIKNKVNSQFTKISRPLGRYEYTSSLDKEQKSLLSQMVNDPFEVLSLSNKDSIIIILENVRKGISSGSISVKDVGKAMESLTETEESLDYFLSELKVFREKKQDLENKLSEFDAGKLSEFENNLSKSVNQKKDEEFKVVSLKKDIDDNMRSIPLKISAIEDNLKRLSKTNYSIISQN